MVGRDPASVRLSATVPACIGATPPTWSARRSRSASRARGCSRPGSPATPATSSGSIEDLASQGADTVYFHVYGPSDVAHIELLGEQVVSRL